jgi:integrase
MHIELDNLLKHARRGIITRNVLEMVEPPHRGNYEARPLRIDEARLPLAAIQEHRYGPLWTFLLGTGCRFGEAAGLTWDAVGLKGGRVVIKQAAVRIREHGKTRLVLAPTKTAAGNRSLPLPP